MEYTYKKGLKISKMSLGTVQLGLDYGINNTIGMPSYRENQEILKTALKGGVNIFDTASDYGKSEEIIGGFLKNNTDPKPIIVTKFTINKGTTKTLSPDDVERIIRNQVERSLQALNLREIPILLLHKENEMFDYGNSLPETLKKLKKEGLIKHIGVSLTSHKYIDFIANNDLYEAVQLPLNMMDTVLISQGGIERLKGTDKIIFIRSVFLQGLFFKEPDNLPPGILQHAKSPLLKLRKLSDDTGLSIPRLAISFIRDLEGVTSLVLGCETTKQLAQNIELINSPPITNEIRAEIISMFSDVDPRLLKPWEWSK